AKAEMLDVPSLLGLWRSAPYLHDNRAASLEEVLGEYNPVDGHGHTRDLSQSERADLITFLESL
ncbi:MAG: hypothetical protein KC910_34125, partial [Candidatus Eremiobacteraeota bacterium]|nr:hypothetical protein [Candidatus Eremiobacteraeota bacterium]